jgi:hypothetical protein
VHAQQRLLLLATPAAHVPGSSKLCRHALIVKQNMQTFVPCIIKPADDSCLFGRAFEQLPGRSMSVLLLHI